MRVLLVSSLIFCGCRPDRLPQKETANNAPVIESVVVSPEAPATNDVLSAESVVWDADGDELEVTYAWRVNSLAKAGVENTLDGSAFAKGDRVTVVVQATDGFGHVSLESEAVVVENTPPGRPGVSLHPNPPEPGEDDLVCSVDVGSEDVDRDVITYTWSWTVDDEAYTGAEDNGRKSTVGAAEIGFQETWRCTVTASDGSATSQSRVETVVTREDPWRVIYEDGFDGSAEGWKIPGCASGGCPYLYFSCWFLPTSWHLLKTPELGFVAGEDWAVSFVVTMNNWYELGVYPDTHTACRTGCGSFYVYANDDTLFMSADGSESENGNESESAAVRLDSINSFGAVNLRIEATEEETCVEVDLQKLLCVDGRAEAPGTLTLHFSHGPGNLFSFTAEGRASVYPD